MINERNMQPYEAKRSDSPGKLTSKISQARLAVPLLTLTGGQFYMLNVPKAIHVCRKPISVTTIIAVLLVSSTFALPIDSKKYDVELVISQGKKSIETDAVIAFDEASFTVLPDKKNFASEAKTFTYTEIKTADQSYSKKPMLSGGGAVATAILLGVFVVPFLFMKKKKHWLTVQTEKEFAVIKLGDNNFRQVVAEMETH